MGPPFVYIVDTTNTFKVIVGIIIHVGDSINVVSVYIMTTGLLVLDVV